ncbi:MAG: hypothetical protein CVV44_22720 [Spirochaetae bacterium HGW-Spirochaetae-1]|nr:MAG: hypothetical protein CVV44_22720 [Spirochaetae bacterium HGW-Spirochaetae-1]
MNCVNCNSKACKAKSVDCTGEGQSTLRKYHDENISRLYADADSLVAGGRAGTLSRIEEIAEFSEKQGYKHIALAYCYGLEPLARDVHAFLTEKGFSVSSFRCTIQGLREKDIVDSLGDSVSCNPIGQAETINKSDAGLVIEIGLCLGHDILFHQHIKKPFTVFTVKDRVFNNSPHLYFSRDKK